MNTTDTESNYNFDKICRSCLSEEDEMTSIFNTIDTDNIRIVDMFLSCAFLQVEEGDGLPNQICLRCYTLIHQSYHFKLQCQTTDSRLKSCLDEEKEPIKIVKIENVLTNSSTEYEQDLNDEFTVMEEVTEIEEIDQTLDDENGFEIRLPFDCKDDLETAEAIYVETVELKCPKCMKKFNDEDMLNIHLTSCEIHECDVCKKKFRTAGYLQNHMRKHDPNFVPDEKRFKCSECDKAYTSPANLQIHKYSHSGIKPFKCQHCGRGFTKLVSLNSHLAIHTGKRTHVCTECGRGFTSTSILNQHKKIHTGERPFKCTECGRSFTASGDLTIHMRSHTGEKPYLCPTCGRSFARITHLNTHFRTHTGERPYVCNECGRGFAQSGDLRSHQRIHSGERPYACTVCNKRFVQSSGLSSHMATHSGVKAHICQVCNRAFSQASSLARHVKAHT